MAYDEELAGRIRGLLGDRAGLTEHGGGGILVRVDPTESEELVEATPAEPMEMRGRQMPGWLRVDTANVADKAALREWVERGTAYAASLPPK